MNPNQNEVNPFLEADSRIKVVRPAAPHLEFWTPKREFWVTAVYEPFDQRWTVRAAPNKLSDTQYFFSLRMSKIDAIKLVRGLAHEPLLETKQAFDSIHPGHPDFGRS